MSNAVDDRRVFTFGSNRRGRPGGLALLIVALTALGGCPPSFLGQLSGPDPRGAEEQTYIGMLRGKLALISLVVQSGEVDVYVCDGNGTARSVSQWFEATLTDDGAFEANVAGGSYYSGASQSWSLRGLIANGVARGTLVIGASEYAWAADYVRDPDDPAGLYVAQDDEQVTATVVLNEAFGLGLSRLKGRRVSLPVATPRRMATPADVRVRVEERTIALEKLRSPIDLKARGFRESVMEKEPAVVDGDPEADAKRLGELIELPGPTNAVQVKFRDGLNIRLGRDGVPADRDGRALRDDAAVDLMKRVSEGGRWNRSHLFVPAQRLDEWRANAQKRLGRAVADLNLYFNLQLPDDLDAEDVARAFRQLREVEYAWVLPTYYLADAPSFQDAANDGFGQPIPYQQYLDPAPVGVDARYAWLWIGGAGEDVAFVDIERGFDREHVDLPEIIENDLFPFDPDDVEPRSLNHGTATLGIVAGLENGTGVTGIAHEADIYFTPAGIYAGLALQYVLGIDGFLSGTIISNAIEPGDVILFEQQMAGPNVGESNISPQFGLVPVEWYKPTWDTIRMATANGYVIVEAAGNGYQDLDGDEYLTSPAAYHQPFLMNGAVRVNDSGAIIVGARRSGATWSIYGAAQQGARHTYSNYGGRVDISCWGDATVTTGRLNQAFLYEDNDPDISEDYIDQYGGTSSASAIVGGVCTALQGFYKFWSNGGVLDSRGMRDVLIATGTPQTPGFNSGHIGPMPDLRNAIETVNQGEPPVEPPPPFTEECPGVPNYIEPVPYCGTGVPFPQPVFSIPSGVLDVTTAADLYLSMEGGFSLSGTIFYTLDGTFPQNCLEEFGNLSCGTTRAWTQNGLRFCMPIEIEPADLPLTIKAISTTALCLPRPSSPLSTAVYVPPGYINLPEFDRPSSYDVTLQIALRTGYTADYPDGYAFVCYTLDGTEPVFADAAADGLGAPTWTDANDDAGFRIGVFENAVAGQDVTLRARNYLQINGINVPGEIVTWTFPAP